MLVPELFAGLLMVCIFPDSWVGIIGKDIDGVIVMKIDLFPQLVNLSFVPWGLGEIKVLCWCCQCTLVEVIIRMYIMHWNVVALVMDTANYAF